MFITTLTGSVVVLTATALASAESAADSRVLEAVGAEPQDLRREISIRLAETEGLAGLPAFLVRSSRGDWHELAECAAASRHIDVPATSLMMDCASGGTPDRLARIRRESEDPVNLLGDVIQAPFYPNACVGLGSRDLGDEFRGPLSCKVPMMFVSGTLDARTPPENVEEIRSGFADHAHIIVQRAGYDARELMSPEYRNLLQAFLRGEAIRSCVLTLPRVLFHSVTEAKAQVAGESR